MYTPYQTSAKVQWREWNRFTRNREFFSWTFYLLRAAYHNLWFKVPAPSRQTSKPVTFGISYEDAPEKLSPTKSSLASMWATSTFDDEPLSANDHFNSSWDNRNLGRIICLCCESDNLLNQTLNDLIIIASKGHPSVIELHTSNLSFSCWNSSSGRT